MDYLREIQNQYGQLIQLVSAVSIIAGALVASASAVIAARQLSATRKVHNFQYELTIRAKSLEYSISRDWDYRNARMAIEEAFRGIDDRQEPITPEEVQQAIAKYPNIEVQIRTLLANYENMALAINAGVADDDVAFELLGAPFLKTTEIFMPYMLAKRAVHPSRYLNLLDLRKKWLKRSIGKIKFYRAYFGKNPESKNRSLKRRRR